MAVLLGLVLLALDFTAYEIHFANQVNQLDKELQYRVAALSATLYAPSTSPPMVGHGPPNQPGDEAGPPLLPPDDLANPPPAQNGNPGPPPKRPALDAARISAATRRFALDLASGFYFSLWARESDAPYRQSSNCPAEVSRPPVAVKDTGTYARTRGTCREMFHTTERGDCVLVGRTLGPEIFDARRFVGWLALGSLVVLAGGLGGAWFIIGRALRPVEEISAAAQRIAAGDLSERIQAGESESELGKLAVVLNSTFARLETAFAQQKHFTSDAAHELRTPLAVLISEAQTTLARDRSPADYRESMTACLDTAQKMRQLTEALLDLARLEAGQELLRREKIDLATIARDCVELVQPLAAARQLQVQCDLAPAGTVGDATRIAQVITNLLSNAIKYNHDGGRIGVATSEGNNGVMLRVADTGCGISTAELPRVFERFYRADKSRSTGGNGLGLSICQAIITAHGGTIEVSSVQNVGTTLTVTLPRPEK